MHVLATSVFNGYGLDNRRFPNPTTFISLRHKWTTMPSVTHPRLTEGVEARGYQLEAVASALSSSTMVVMPTGFGKSAVEWMVIAHHLHHDGKVLLLAPTVALLAQHQRMLRAHVVIDENDVVMFTGQTPPAKRPERWASGTIVLATAQVVRNDAMSGAIDLSELSLVVVDEAHHARGQHAYAQVADLVQSTAPDATVLGATASPGTSREVILEVERRLGIERWSVHAREDPGLSPYAVDLSVASEHLALPESLLHLIAPLAEEERAVADRLRRQGYLADTGHLTAAMLDNAQRKASASIARRDRRGYEAARSVSDLRRLHLLLDLLRCQGMEVAKAFLDRQAAKGGEERKKASRLLDRPAVRQLRESLDVTAELHPKPHAVERLLEARHREKADTKTLVFTEYRDTVDRLVERLSLSEHLSPIPFVGQSKAGERRGMTQKEQVAQIDAFRRGDANVLIATSVGEEGLDIPAADLVVFYEPVASAVRAIQRRGRTGRHADGEVVMLVAEGTRDAHMLRASASRERRMMEHLRRLGRTRRLHEFTAESDPLAAFEVNTEDTTIAASRFVEEERARLRPVKAEPETERQGPAIEAPTHRPGAVRPEERRHPEQASLFGWEKPVQEPEPGRRPDAKRRNAPVVLDGRSTAHALDAMGAMEIILDRREASSTLAAGLRARGIKPVFRHLVTGDVRIGPRLLLERKTAKDLHASVRDGRLLSQVRRLAAAAPRAGLLLETGSGLEGATHPNAVHGALAWMAFDLGLSVICVKDAEESAAFLALAARRELAWLDALEHAHAPKAEDDVHLSLMAAQRALEDEDNQGGMNERWTSASRRRRTALLEAIEGVGPVTAAALAESFESIAALANASAEELASVSGIGAGRAAEVHRALHG